MKATVKIVDLKRALSAIHKITGKPYKIYIKADENGTLSIISNTSSYLKFTIPATKVEKGTIALHASLFESMMYVRKPEIELAIKGNTLIANSGTKLKLYCMDCIKEEIKIPDVGDLKPIILKSKAVGILRKMLEKTNFFPVDELENVPISITNNKKGVTLGMADSVHCAFYNIPKSISKDKFTFLTDLTAIKAAMSFLEDKATFTVANNIILIQSSNIIATLPALQVGSDKNIKNALTFLEKSNYKKGSIEFSEEQLDKVLSSVSVISEGLDILKLGLKKKQIVLGLKTSFGTSKDSFKCNNNTLGTISLDLPILMFENVLNSCSIGKNINMKVSKRDNFCLVSTKNKNMEVKCITPVASVS